MKTVGIIAEYNPFHNGHAYQIAQAKKITGADYCVVVMSGNFVQRGTVSIMDKYLRTEAALSSGADVVLELPVRFATSSAEFFALGGVSLLHHLNCIDYLCFGSETGELSPLLAAATLLYNEPEAYKYNLRQYIKEGNSFPVARKLAVFDYLSEQNLSDTSITTSMISCFESPNDLLGIEYCKAILSLKSSIQPVVVKRMDAGYHMDKLPTGSAETNQNLMTSATSLRNALDTESPDKLLSFIPANAAEIYQAFYQKSFPIHPDDLSELLLYKLRLDQLKGYAMFSDVSIDISNKIKQKLNSCASFSEYCMAIKSKDLTLTRCQRVLLHILLEITSENLKQSVQNPEQIYARLLGFCSSSSALLRVISDTADIPLITKVADAANELSPICQQMLTEDLFAADLYRSLLYQKYHFTLPSEYQKGPVIWKTK